MDKDCNGDIIHFIKDKIDNSINDNKLNESGFEFDDNKIFNVNFNEEKISNLKVQYNMFKLFLYQKLRRKEYKTVVNQIEGNYQLYKLLDESEELLFLKIEILIKIINHKIQKYNFNEEENINQKDSNKLKIKLFQNSKPSNKIIKKIFKKKNLCEIKYKYQNKLNNMNIAINIEKYYTIINKELNKLIENIKNIYQNSQVIYIEKIIQLFLKLFFVKALHHEKIFQLPYTIYYLSLSKQLINNFNDYFRNIETFVLIEKIYLYIAKIFFINRDFLNVEKYCFYVIKYCFRELIFRFGDKNKIILLKQKEKKVFFNLTHSILFLAFCQEEFGKINIALQYYNLIKYINKNFLNDYRFETLSNNLSIRANEYNFLFKYIFKEREELFKKKKYHSKKEKVSEEKNLFLSSNNNNYNLIEKFFFSNKLQKIKEKSNITIIETHKKLKSQQEKKNSTDLKSNINNYEKNNENKMNIQNNNNNNNNDINNNKNKDNLSKEYNENNENLNKKKFRIQNSNSLLNINNLLKEYKTFNSNNLNKNKVKSEKLTRNISNNDSLINKIDDKQIINNNNYNYINIKKKEYPSIGNYYNNINLNNKINSCPEFNQNDDSFHFSFSYNLNGKKFFIFPSYQINENKYFTKYDFGRKTNLFHSQIEMKKKNFHHSHLINFKKIYKIKKEILNSKLLNLKNQKSKIILDSVKNLYISSPDSTKIKKDIFSYQYSNNNNNEKNSIPILTLLHFHPKRKNEKKKSIISKLYFTNNNNIKTSQSKSIIKQIEKSLKYNNSKKRLYST